MLRRHLRVGGSGPDNGWISSFKGGNIDDKEFQRHVIDTFVNSVYVYDDRIVITFNFKRGTDSLTFDSINSDYSSVINGDTPPSKQDRKRSCFSLEFQRFSDATTISNYSFFVFSCDFWWLLFIFRVMMITPQEFLLSKYDSEYTYVALKFKAKHDAYDYCRNT